MDMEQERYEEASLWIISNASRRETKPKRQRIASAKDIREAMEDDTGIAFTVDEVISIFSDYGYTIENESITLDMDCQAWCKVDYLKNPWKYVKE